MHRVREPGESETTADRFAAHPPPSRLFLKTVAVATLILGIAAAIIYAQQGLTLSHYDAKAHLVVARRIVDSLRPGWWQVGAVWLPLPHLLNVIPVQIDWLYHTGLFGVAISIASFVATTTMLFWLVARATWSHAAAAAAVVVYAAQPDVLYLQSTPMTEPLLMALCLASVTLLWQWIDGGAVTSVRTPGIALALACLTRYEAWPITVAALGLAFGTLHSRGLSIQQAAAATLRLGLYPMIAFLAFLVWSRASVGEWLVTGGFYIVDNPAYREPIRALGAVWYGLRQVNGPVTVGMGAAALLVLLGAAMRFRRYRPLLIVLALGASAALPLYAFWEGHPFRVRYMVVLGIAVAAVTGLGIGLLPRGRAVVAALVSAVALIETPPFSPRAPMVLEAQWDRPRSIERQRVTSCLADARDDLPILASMGSLAHYMHETSHAGFELRDYIHEGIGQIWTDSLVAARRHAGWVLIEEQAEGGDMLAKLRDSSPEFLKGFERVCEGGGVALYRRNQSSGQR
jgi:hypothetical protein